MEGGRGREGEKERGERVEGLRGREGGREGGGRMREGEKEIEIERERERVRRSCATAFSSTIIYATHHSTPSHLSSVRSSTSNRRGGDGSKDGGWRRRK